MTRELALYASRLRYAAGESRDWDSLPGPHRAQAETALWSSTFPSGKPLDSRFSSRDIHPTTLGHLSDALDSFFAKLRDWDAKGTQKQKAAAEEILRNNHAEVTAHDFWLARNDHGGGFSEGDYENGDALLALAKSFGPVDLYYGTDGQLHHRGSPEGVDEAPEPYGDPEDPDDDDEPRGGPDDPEPPREPRGPRGGKALKPEIEPALAFARAVRRVEMRVPYGTDAQRTSGEVMIHENPSKSDLISLINSIDLDNTSLKGMIDYDGNAYLWEIPRGGEGADHERVAHKLGKYVPHHMRFYILESDEKGSPVIHPKINEAKSPEVASWASQNGLRLADSAREEEDGLAFARAVRYAASEPRDPSLVPVTSETIRGILADGEPAEWATPDSVRRGVLADAVQDETDDEELPTRIRSGEYGVDWFFTKRGVHKGMSADFIKPPLSQYLETALWADTDDDGIPLDEPMLIKDFHPEALREAQKAIESFVSYVRRKRDEDDSWADAADEMEERMGELGHAIWLTRNRQDGGFWNGDWENQSALAAAAFQLQEASPYFADDGHIHFM